MQGRAPLPVRHRLQPMRSSRRQRAERKINFRVTLRTNSSDIIPPNNKKKQAIYRLSKFEILRINSSRHKKTDGFLALLSLYQFILTDNFIHYLAVIVTDGFNKRAGLCVDGTWPWCPLYNG